MNILHELHQLEEKTQKILHSSAKKDETQIVKSIVERISNAHAETIYELTEDFFHLCNANYNYSLLINMIKEHFDLSNELDNFPYWDDKSKEEIKTALKKRLVNIRETADFEDHIRETYSSIKKPKSFIKQLVDVNLISFDLIVNYNNKEHHNALLMKQLNQFSESNSAKMKYISQIRFKNIANGDLTILYNLKSAALDWYQASPFDTTPGTYHQANHVKDHRYLLTDAQLQSLKANLLAQIEQEVDKLKGETEAHQELIFTIQYLKDKTTQILSL
ncbi:hypothetical protein QTG56_24315 (plasmid) [Rossellomorea sp. AcN35-11]|nr:hypothetical protein [Rossellomorea aquimaris]WJV31765.1 hypothetical protein QTG56_24315 [Rossellomorea sp. AcN35-11]